MKNKYHGKGLLCLLLTVAAILTGTPTLQRLSEPIKDEADMRDLPIQAVFQDLTDTPAASLALGVPALGMSKLSELAVLDPQELEGLMLCPGGMPFGVKFLTEGVSVVGFCDIEVGGVRSNPATAAGLRLKDVILKVNGEPLMGAAQLTDRIEQCKGEELTLLCRRQKQELELKLKPIWSPTEARYKTGIWVRDSGAGIGTVTFIMPDTGAFAGLGHGICDADTGELVPMRRGSVSDVTISSVVKGAAGAPGELKGYFKPGKTGSLLGNTACGVWGILSELPENAAEPLPIGLRQDVHAGDAYILCTLDQNKTEQYDIEISNIHADAQGSKCFTVKITDPELLAHSGGIVQGMSGSPIIQDGKLIGAVTHVLINDPTAGYGIFLENMLVNMPVPVR